MPRQSRGPSRPVAAPARAPAPQPAQSRPASTLAHPQQHPVQHAPPPQQVQGSAGPGLFGQMASTAAGVAVGSSIGHAIGGMFGGGSSAPPAAPVESQQQLQQGQANYAQPAAQGACANDINNFRRCMDENQGSLNICGWYLDQLKACQAAASQY